MSKSRRFSAQQTPAAEWITAAVGALIVLATMGVLLYDAAYGVHHPPLLRAVVISAAREGDAFKVEIRVSNEGTATAADVIVHGELLVDERVVERAEANIDYIAGRSSKVVGLLLTRDPAAGRFMVRPVGYRVP